MLLDDSDVITSVLNVAACSLHPGSPLTKLATLREEEERTLIKRPESLCSALLNDQHVWFSCVGTV